MFELHFPILSLTVNISVFELHFPLLLTLNNSNSFIFVLFESQFSNFYWVMFEFLHYLVAVIEFWYCTCKKRIFHITYQNGKTYKLTARAENCFHCWFVFLIKIKINIIYKKRNNLVHLASLLIDFFKLINKFKYIYQKPDYQNMDFDYYNSFNWYFNENLSCLCYNNKSSINFL